MKQPQVLGTHATLLGPAAARISPQPLRCGELRDDVAPPRSVA